ncbi:hypothetical protein ES703_101945 [subsurface metagenome]
MKVVSIVGMAGAGKSEVARVFEENDFAKIRFGDITDEEIKKQSLEPNEKSERYVREFLRQEYNTDGLDWYSAAKCRYLRRSEYIGWPSLTEFPIRFKVELNLKGSNNTRQASME